VEEQLHCWNTRERLGVWEPLAVWQREGWDAELVLGTQVQDLVAGDQDLHAGSGS
jgi:hypothetical protein